MHNGMSLDVLEFFKQFESFGRMCDYLSVLWCYKNIPGPLI